MSYILDIATAIPQFSITKENLVNFYTQALKSQNDFSTRKKIAFINERTKINKRYSCISDFNGKKQELFIDECYEQPIENRMKLYKEKIMPLATKAIDKVFLQTNIDTSEITHLITVSCTGLFAPGFEFLVSEHYKLQHAEKIALNFLGCYAAIKALKQAHYIAESNPDACILIISAELCTLLFYPSDSDEDIVANLLFTDGAAAAIICGKQNRHIKNKIVLNIDKIGSSYIPDTLSLMTWNVSSSAFRMYLSKEIVNTIKSNIHPIVSSFLKGKMNKTDYWAIHPGGYKIVQAVKDSLGLSENDIEDSTSILREYGNMSSPTILFILNRIFNKVRESKQENKHIFSCGFGPGLSVEMISLSSMYINSTKTQKIISRNNVVTV